MLSRFRASSADAILKQYCFSEWGQVISDTVELFGWDVCWIYSDMSALLVNLYWFHISLYCTGKEPLYNREQSRPRSQNMDGYVMQSCSLWMAHLEFMLEFAIAWILQCHTQWTGLFITDDNNTYKILQKFPSLLQDSRVC